MAIITGGFGLAGTILALRKPKKEENDSKTELKEHSFFRRIEVLSSHVERSFSLENKGKETVFKDIIINQLIIISNNLEILVNKVDENKIADKNALYNENLECFNNIINKLHTYYKGNPNYTLEEQQALDIVMRKYETWSNDKLNNITESIMMACNSPFYDTVETRTAVILDLYLAFSIDIINYAEKTLNHINGDLRGLIFKGITI